MVIVSGRGPTVQLLLSLANSAGVARRIVRDEDRTVLVDVGQAAGRNFRPAHDVAERAVCGLYQLEPLPLTVIRGVKKDFCAAVVLPPGRSSLRWFRPDAVGHGHGAED